MALAQCGTHRFMTTLAIWEAPTEGTESDWGDLVTDAEYLAAAERPEARR